MSGIAAKKDKTKMHILKDKEVKMKHILSDIEEEEKGMNGTGMGAGYSDKNLFVTSSDENFGA